MKLNKKLKKSIGQNNRLIDNLIIIVRHEGAEDPTLSCCSIY